jgi:two-component system nitrogen regulation response regulator NtrX
MRDARILVVDDESEIRTLLKEILTEEGYRVTTAQDAAAAREQRDETEPDLVLLDIWMPDTDGISLLKEWSEEGGICPVVMMSGHGTVDTAVEATRLGAVDFIEKPLSLTKLLHTVEKALDEGAPGRAPRRTLVPPMMAPVGKSDAVQAVKEQLRRIAYHDTPVLFTGEPGSGREAYARYLHSLSNRAGQPFTILTASGMGSDTAEQILFGDRDRPGLLAEAEGGVLFINELSDLTSEAQRLLLGALEQGRYRPRGAAEDRSLNLRVLSSAPPGFDQKLNSFRQELLSLISVMIVRVPPLRDYAEDVPELLRYYADLLVDAEGLSFRRFSVAAQNRLRNYPWPGNVRELKNLVKRLLIMGGDEEISLREVEAQLKSDAPNDQPLLKQDLLAMPLREAREHFERAYLQQQLVLCNGKVGQLAKRVGMERTHLYRKLRSLGVDFRQVSAED